MNIWKTTGVYIILNKANGKVYVGSAAQSFGKRWSGHRRSLQLGNHKNRHLQAAWNKYGEELFEFSVVEECLPVYCTVLETRWIEHYNSADRNKGYNQSPVGGSTLGTKHSAEARAKMSAAKIGNKYSVGRTDSRGRKYGAEVRGNMSAAHIGKKHTDETKVKMSLKRKGRRISSEHKANISKSQQYGAMFRRLQKV